MPRKTPPTPPIPAEIIERFADLEENGGYQDWLDLEASGYLEAMQQAGYLSNEGMAAFTSIQALEHSAALEYAKKWTEDIKKWGDGQENKKHQACLMKIE
ncbi:MAG: hypothetical protein R3E89_04685 [Thiolinea sp.]